MKATFMLTILVKLLNLFIIFSAILLTTELNKELHYKQWDPSMTIRVKRYINKCTIHDTLL